MPAEMPVPPEVPIIKFFTPSKNDRGLIEFHNSTTAAYQPLDEGAVHPNTRDFAGYKLGKQFNLPNDHKWIIRIWVTDETDPTWWNWAEKFSADANAYPIFIREYREPRKTYAPLTKGQPLKSLYKLSLSTAGTGYDPAALPALTFNNGGTGGTGAAGHAVVNPDGTIAALVLDDGGDGYNSAPTFTIAAPPAGGTTATGTAVIQPATALLVAEEAQQFPDDSEFRGLYLNVVRVYETLPGPTIPYTRFDDNLGPVQGTRQAVLWNNQTADLTAIGKTTYEARDGSSIVAWKIVEAWSDGSGGAGNPAFPNQEWTEFERDGVKKVISKQLTPIGDIVTDETLVGGVLTRKYSQPFNQFLAFQVIETITVEDATLLDQPTFEKRRDDTVPERFKATVPAITTKHILSGKASAPTLATGDIYRSERQLTPLYYELTITNRDIASLPTLEGQKYDEELNILIPYTEQVVAAGSAIGDASKDVQPLGGGLDLVTTYDLSAIATAFASFQLVFPGKANLDLPDVLSDLELLNETHEGAGDSTTPYFYGAWSIRGSYTVSPAGTAQGSQSVMPELIPTIVPTYANRKNTTRLVFLLPMPVTSADVLAKVAAILGASVSDWPDFHPKPIHAVLTGRQISLSVHASYHVQDGGSADSSEHGESFVRGYSTEVGMVVKTKEISPTIHGDLSSGLDPYTIASFDLTADAYYDSETQTTPALSTGIEVRGAGATGGQQTIPSTGKHLLEDQGSVYRYNHAMFHAEVFDFADL